MAGRRCDIHSTALIMHAPPLAKLSNRIFKRGRHRRVLTMNCVQKFVAAFVEMMESLSLAETDKYNWLSVRRVA